VSDTSQGQGWWQASDEKWYPPEQHPGAEPPSLKGKDRRRKLRQDLYPAPEHLSLFLADLQYLGGFPEDPNRWKANCSVNEDGVVSKRHAIPWSQTKGVTIDGGEVAKSKVGATLAFGVLGGLAARGAMDRAYLAIYRDDGATGHFQIDRMTPQNLRAQMAPILLKVGIPFLDDQYAASANPAPQEPAAPASVADELAKLMQLHDAGGLTDDEFAAMKAKVING
jgi:hypothetical protein